jgi:hypothetical protein
VRIRSVDHGSLGIITVIIDWWWLNWGPTLPRYYIDRRRSKWWRLGR